MELPREAHPRASVGPCKPLSARGKKHLRTMLHAPNSPMSAAFMRLPPIFIVGCSRSGSTLLQSIIGQHPKLSVFPEANALFPVAGDRMLRAFGTEIPQKSILKQRVTGRLNRIGWSAGRGKSYRRNIQRFLRDIDREDLLIGADRPFPTMASIFAHFSQTFDVLADGQRWVEKSPQNVFMLDYLQRYLPQAQVLHVVRDGQANIASLRDAGLKYKDFRGRFGGHDGAMKAVAFWNQALRASLLFKDSKQHFLLRYEDLCAAPEAVVREVCAFLGLQFEASMLRYSTDGIVLSKEAWKRSDQAIRLAPSKFSLVLTEREQKTVRSQALNVDDWLPLRFTSARASGHH